MSATSSSAAARGRGSRVPFARYLTPVAGVLATLALSACGAGVSTSGYKGESKAVAQRIADFQKDAAAVKQQNVCGNDLASSVKAKLKAAGGDCQSVLKEQLKQIDNVELEVESVAVTGTTATARVKSTWSGKSRLSTLALVKENGSWRIAALQ